MTEKYTQLLLDKGDSKNKILTTFSRAGIPIIFNGRELSANLPELPHQSH